MVGKGSLFTLLAAGAGLGVYLHYRDQREFNALAEGLTADQRAMTFDWTKHSPTTWEYVSDDLCACVWAGYDVVWWDVSGPEGRGTIASGCTPGSEECYLHRSARMIIAQRLAEAYIAGFRRGRETNTALLPGHQKDGT